MEGGGSKARRALDFKKWGGSGLGALYKFTPMPKSDMKFAHGIVICEPVLKSKDKRSKLYNAAREINEQVSK